VLDGNIVSALFRSGISDDEGLLQPLGLTWPDNFYRTDVVAGAIERAKAAAAEGRPVMLMTFGGGDVGMGNYMLVAFALFGVNIGATYYAYFVFLGLGAALFVWRFHDRPLELGAAALMLTALAIIVCSDLISHVRLFGTLAGAPGSSIKDSRFFGTVAAIPLLHLLCLWAR